MPKYCKIEVRTYVKEVMGMKKKICTIALLTTLILIAFAAISMVKAETTKQEAQAIIDKNNNIINQSEKGKTARNTSNPTVPSKNADAITIRDFLLNENSSNMFNSIDGTTLSAWKKTLDSAIQFDKKTQNNANSGSALNITPTDFTKCETALEKLKAVQTAKSNGTSTYGAAQKVDITDGQSAKKALDSLANANIEQAEEEIKKYESVLGVVSGEPRSAVTSVDALSDAGYYTPADKTGEGKEAIKIAGRILGAIQNIGIVAAVVIAAVIGFKYILGSLEERAEYKQTLLPYVIGVVLLVAVPTVANILYKLGTSLKA